VQGTPLVPIQGIPGFGVHATRKRVGIVSWLGDHGQHVTRAWVHGHKRTHLGGLSFFHFVKCLFRCALQIQINSQTNRSTGNGVHFFNQVHFPPRDIDHDDATPFSPTQMRFQNGFEPRLANYFTRSISGELTRFQLVCSNFTQGAKQMSTQFLIQIVPAGPHIRNHPGQGVTVRRDPRQLIRREIAHDSNGFKSISALGHANAFF